VDEVVLREALGSAARYVGLIGSKRKVATIFRNLRALGLPDPSDDPRVFAPIGLDVGSKEPGEIALAVLAEVLAVRDGRTAVHRRLPSWTERRVRRGEAGALMLVGSDRRSHRAR
jgi:xanthine dehydrogenase accessory factor